MDFLRFISDFYNDKAHDQFSVFINIKFIKYSLVCLEAVAGYNSCSTVDMSNATTFVLMSVLASV